MTFSYNRNKQPPRPECEVFISNTRRMIMKRVKAIADTGADITMIPKNVIQELGNLTQSDSIRCQGVNGTVTELATYYINIRIGHQDFPNHLVALCPREYAIIGRDIINQNKASFHATGDSWRLNCGEICA